MVQPCGVPSVVPLARWLLHPLRGWAGDELPSDPTCRQYQGDKNRDEWAWRFGGCPDMPLVQAGRLVPSSRDSAWRGLLADRGDALLKSIAHPAQGRRLSGRAHCPGMAAFAILVYDSAAMSARARSTVRRQQSGPGGPHLSMMTRWDRARIATNRRRMRTVVPALIAQERRSNSPETCEVFPACRETGTICVLAALDLQDTGIGSQNGALRCRNPRSIIRTRLTA